MNKQHIALLSRNPLTLQNVAHVLLILGILLMGYGFLGVRCNATDAPFPDNPLILLARQGSVPLMIAGLAVLVLSILLGNAALNRRWMLADYFPYLLILPATVFLVIFVVYPMLNVVYLSLFNGTVMNTTQRFMGINNYKIIFTVQRDFNTALINTAVYTVAMVVGLIALSLICALWLQRDRKINTIAQTVFFTPHLVASISCAFIFQWLMSDQSYGLFNTVLQALGFAPVNWLNNPDTAMGCIIFMNLWKNVGYYTLIIMSALKSIPTEIYEAATLDRAGTLRTFFKITLPMLSPQIFFLLITITTGSFMVFDSINVMTAGGPGNSTEVLARYIYKYAFTLNKLGVASAAGTVLMLILILITFLDFKGLEKKVHYQ